MKRTVLIIYIFTFSLVVFSQLNNQYITNNHCNTKSSGSVDINLYKSIPINGGYGGFNPVLVGDLDGDNKPELVTVATDYRYNAASFVVFKGGELYKSNYIKFGKRVGTPNMSFGYACGPLAIARIKKSNGSYQGFIFAVVGTEDGKFLQSYIYNSIDEISLYKETPLQTNLFGNVSIADFNQDGKAEVFVGTEVFDAYSLSPIGSAVNSGNLGRHLQHDGAIFTTSAAGDIFNHKKGLELVCGNQVYSVDPNKAPNGVNLISTVGGKNVDGSALIADFNNDDNLDILVRTPDTKLWLFSPSNNTVFENGKRRMMSLPAVGDIDGDGVVEIIGLSSNTRMTAYKYDNQKALLTEFWTVSHSDNSAQTVMTLFDFNNDGIQEIVYRDETLLRIINGSGKNPNSMNSTQQGSKQAVYNLATMSVKSKTKSEYPVIADFNNDGETEIIVPGVMYKNADIDNAAILIFKAGSYPWAKTPAVWNQYNYDPLLVNPNNTINSNCPSKTIKLNGKSPFNSCLWQTGFFNTAGAGCL